MFSRISLEGCFNRFALAGIHAPIKRQQALFNVRACCGKALACQETIEPVLGSAIFCEEDHALIRPLPIEFECRMQPVDQFLCLAVGSMTCLLCPRAHL